MYQKVQHNWKSQVGLTWGENENVINMKINLKIIIPLQNTLPNDTKHYNGHRNLPEGKIKKKLFQ